MRPSIDRKIKSTCLPAAFAIRLRAMTRSFLNLILVSLSLLTGCKAPEPKAAAHRPGATTLSKYQEKARQFNSIISLPALETAPAAVHRSVSNAMAEANAALRTRLVRKNPGKMTFENTVRALDDLSYKAGLTANRIGLLKETSTNAAVRGPAPRPPRFYRNGPSASIIARTFIKRSGPSPPASRKLARRRRQYLRK